jgi:sugar phosphate isomerase/epimerase
MNGRGDITVTQITLLNSMVSRNFNESLEVQQSWGIQVLDLKDHIYGKSVIDLSEDEAGQAAQAIASWNMSVYCLSTDLFHSDIEAGEQAFQARHMERIAQTIAVARKLQPTVIRLIAAYSSRRNEFTDAVAYAELHHPWLLPMYRKAIDLLNEAGFQVTIENESRNCLMSNPQEIIAFFQELDRPGTFFTYDVQNLWQMGTFPSAEVYRQLAPLIGYYHLKGGQADENGTQLKWKSSLEDASWPIPDITRLVVQDGTSEVICLNPSHGVVKEGYNYDQIAQRDFKYLQILLNSEGQGS